MNDKPKAVKIQPGGSPDYGREISGRCRRCNIRFLWPARYGLLKETSCPFCNRPLRATTHLFKGDTYRLEFPGGRKND